MTTLGEIRRDLRGRTATPPLGGELAAFQQRLDTAARALIQVSPLLQRYYQEGKVQVVASANVEAEARLIGGASRNGSGWATDAGSGEPRSIILIALEHLRETEPRQEARLIELLSQSLWQVERKQLELGGAALAIVEPGLICKRVISDLNAVRGQWVRARAPADKLAYLDGQVLGQRRHALQELRAARQELISQKGNNKLEISRIDGQIAEHLRMMPANKRGG